MTRIWCNGIWLEALDFTTSPTDRGLMHGLGLFETILAVNGRPIFADLHVERLLTSCGRLGWKPAFPDLPQIMAELIQVNELTTGRARIRLAISGGSGMVHDLALGADHVIWMTAVPAMEPPLAASANLSPWVRNERSALAGLKCAAYAENLVALQHAARLGFEETVFLNTAGHLCEAATSNLFLVKNGVVLTPSTASGCLPGITRAVVIALAAENAIPCEERDLTRDDLSSADELFLTSSIRGVMGVSRFDDRTFPPGPVTRVLREAWTTAILRKTAAGAKLLH
jgi:branched-subunit amino acid aminotransferase/4-amino-4-deoxychorismate lyase